MSNPAGLTERFVDYAHDLRLEDVPRDVQTRTKEMLLDFLGVAFGGAQVADSSAPVTAAVRELAAGAEGASTAVAQQGGMPAHYAALLNATYAHSMDFDDTHRDSVIHVGTPLFATLLAIAEERGVPGADFLSAAIAGYDVTAKLGRLHGGDVHARGFHPTATTGLFGSTLAGARLMGLTKEQSTNAAGLNVSQSAGSLQFLANGAWNKRVHVGLTAHNAIVALTMGRHGFIGASDPLEGRDGYLRLYAQGVPDDLSVLDTLGSGFEVMETALKPYPSCRYTHAVIDVMTALRASGGLEPENVEAIEIGLGPTGYALVADPADPKRAPKTVVDGQFSVYFTTAAALAKGRFDWDAYGLMEDPEVRGLMRRVSVEHVPSRGAGLGAAVRVRTTNGQDIERVVELPKGEPENPMSWDEVRGKFMEWAGGVLGPDRAAKVAEKVANIEELDSVAELGGLLRS